MTTIRDLLLFIVVAVGVGWVPQALADQTKSTDTCGILDLYDRLLPRHATTEDAAGAVEIVTLRYIPGDTTLEREYRVVLRSDSSNSLRAVLTEPVGLSIQAQVRQLREAGELSCDAQLERVQLKKREFTDQRALRQIMGRLHSLRTKAELASEFYLDAPRYEITIQAGMNEASWQLYGPESHSLIRWFRRTCAALSIAVRPAK